MRYALVFPAAIVLAACTDRTPMTAPAPADTQSSSDARTSKVLATMPSTATLAAASRDAIERLVPGLEADAARSVGNAIEQMESTLLHQYGNTQAMSEAYRRVASTLDDLRDDTRLDSATLETIALEFGLDR